MSEAQEFHPMPEGRFKREEELLALMRAAGVARFKMFVDGAPFEVEFSLAAPTGRVEATLPDILGADETGAGTCACGHDYTEHNSAGQCVRGGCPVQACAAYGKEAMAPLKDE